MKTIFISYYLFVIFIVVAVVYLIAFRDKSLWWLLLLTLVQLAPTYRKKA